MKVPFSADFPDFTLLTDWLQPQEMVRPAVNEPVHILSDRFYVLALFLGWICVLHSQMSNAGKFSGDTEIEADRFSMPDMEVTVRFGRKSGMDLREIWSEQIGGDDIANEIGRCTLRPARILEKQNSLSLSQVFFLCPHIKSSADIA